MINQISYEELNQMIENPRSEPFEDYFEDMELSESDKKKRILLAEKLRDNFLPILFFLFTYQKYELAIDWEEIRLRFEIGYKAGIDGLIDFDKYTENRIKIFSYDVIDSTQNHMDDVWYYSIDRAKFISENESNISWEYQAYVDAIKSGKSKKKWVTMRDKRVRHTHRKMEGKTIGINDVFLVGNSIMLHSGDSSMGAEAKELISCRCTTKYF